MIRDTVRPPVDPTRNHIDRDIRLVFTAVGPEHRHVDNVTADATLRRVRNLYYTQDFAQVLYQECMLYNAKVRDRKRHPASSSRMLGVSQLDRGYGSHGIRDNMSCVAMPQSGPSTLP